MQFTHYKSECSKGFTQFQVKSSIINMANGKYTFFFQVHVHSQKKEINVGLSEVKGCEVGNYSVE